MKKYICCHCLKELKKGDKVYWVENSRHRLIPACSKECGEYFKIFVINKLEKKLKSVKNQIIEEDIL